MRWFEIGLVVLTFATGIIWLLDRLFFAKARERDGGLLESKEPVLVDYSRAFFPVLLIVLMLRSFIAEPFRIPSSSMMPSLLIGDFILVNKFAYGLRLPITNKKFVATGEPKRGDVVVFKPPHHPRTGLDQARDRPAGRHRGLPRQHRICERQAFRLPTVGSYIGKGQGERHDRRHASDRGTARKAASGAGT